MATVNKAFRVKNGLAVDSGSLLPAAGTSSYAPITFTAGTNLSPVSAGTMEFDGTRFYLNPSTTRRAVALTDSTGATLDSGITASSLTSVGTLANLTVTNTITGSVSGSAGSVANAFTIKADTGTTEGTDLYTFNGAAGKTLNIVGGTNITITKTSGQWSIAAAGSGSGTVTSVSVVSANGFAGTVATSTSTPAITLTTSITGLLKGNGTAISAATAGTDYLVPSGSANISTSGTIASSNTTASTSSTTGAITSAGGLGVAADLYVGGNTVITGNLTVNGTTTTINSTTISVDDANIELGSVASPTDTTANGGGITLKGATDKTIIWDSANTNWTSSENWNIATGKVFKINNVSTLSATTLGTAVVNSSLTKVGALSGGTAGFVKADASGNLTTDSSTYLTSSTGVTTVNGSSGAITNVALTSGKLSQFAATSSSELAGVVSDETGTGALVFAGSPALTGTVTVNAIAGLVTATGSGSTLFTMSSIFDKTVYNGGEFIVKLTDGTDFEIIKVLVVIKGTTVYVTQYADVVSNVSLGTIDFTLSTNNVNMTVTPAAGTVTAKVTGTLIAA